MLLPRIYRPFCSRILSCRGNTTASSTLYHPKVRAYPFFLSKDDAINHVTMAACLFGGGTGLFRSILAHILPNSGFQALQPERAMAAYLPVWLVDAEIQAKAWIPKSREAEPSQQTVTAHFADCYVPGFAMDPVSHLSFNCPEPHEAETVPFTDDLQHQHDEEILCMPYEFTPFLLTDLVRSSSFQQATISKKFRFDPSSVKDNVVAAYPVLCPIYLLQYELVPWNSIGAKKDTLIFIVDASRKNSVIYVNNSFLKRLMNHPIFQVVPQFKLDSGPGEFTQISGPADARFSNVVEFSDVSGTAARRKELAHWIDAQVSVPGPLDGYKKIWNDRNGGAAASVDFDDLRVREYVKEEKRAVRDFMRLTLAQHTLEKVIETISSLPTEDSNREQEPSRSTKFGPIRIEIHQKGKFQEHIQKELEAVKKERENQKPQWLKQYEEQHKPPN